MLPQVTKNIPVQNKQAVKENEIVKKEVEAIRFLLGNGGRILLRESGTEPLIRVMVEAQSEEECYEYVMRVVNVIKKEGLAE
jgi:phosphoglucosamine mutase